MHEHFYQQIITTKKNNLVSQNIQGNCYTFIVSLNFTHLFPFLRWKSKLHQQSSHLHHKSSQKSLGGGTSILDTEWVKWKTFQTETPSAKNQGLESALLWHWCKLCSSSRQYFWFHNYGHKGSVYLLLILKSTPHMIAQAHTNTFTGTIQAQLEEKE